MAKYAVSAPQADLLRELAAVSDAVRTPPGRTHSTRPYAGRLGAGATRADQEDLARQWSRRRVTADGRYYLKHGKHPRQVQAEKERLAGDSAQPALAPAPSRLSRP